MTKSYSERFRYITPANAILNTAMLAILGFFLTQTYFRLDRIEAKQDKQGEMIARMEGYLRVSCNPEHQNLTGIKFLENEKGS